MRDRVKELIEAAAAQLAAKAHTPEELHDRLFQLALDITSPAGTEVPRSLRRQPGANEVLPRHQRATWARSRTEYDAAEG